MSNIVRQCVFAVIVSVMVLGLPACTSADEEVTFPDSGLETAIREAIGKAEEAILKSDLEALTTFTAVEKSITDITGLEFCINLEFLNLQKNQISDISPLASLKKLTELYLYQNEIVSVEPLASLTNLNIMGLNRNQIVDVSPLASLVNLQELDLRHNFEISDISALASLTELTKLWLDWNKISDISSLASLAKLADLWLANNQIVDIEPLVNNDGLSEGDNIKLDSNPLSSQSIDEYIPQLEARGVTVTR